MNSDSDWQVALPFRGANGSKSRLALDQRQELALSWLSRVIDQCRDVSRVSEVTVVGCAVQAPFTGVSYLQQRRPGLNGAIADWLEDRCPGRWLVILPDLPLLRSADILALLDSCPPGGIAVACDRHEQGSNALACDGAPFLTRFGPQSLQAHRDVAAELGRPFHCLKLAGLACDVDTLDDWEALQCPLA